MTTTHLLTDTAGVPIQSTFFTGQPGAAAIGNTPGSLVTNLLPNLILAAGIILLILIFYSGFHLITDAGSTNAQVIAKHKSMITVGIIGFLIVLASYFILEFVLTSLGISDIMYFGL